MKLVREHINEKFSAESDPIKDIDMEHDKIYSLEDVQKLQSEGFMSMDLIFDAKPGDRFILTQMHVNDFREEYHQINLEFYKKRKMDSSYSIAKKIMDRIVNDKPINPIVVDKKGEIMDGRHRYAAYRQLYDYHSYDFSFNGKINVFKQL